MLEGNGFTVLRLPKVDFIVQIWRREDKIPLFDGFFKSINI